MTLQEAKQKVEEQIVKHNLAGYTFEWMQKRARFSTAGSVNYKRKVIRLQPTYVELNDDKDIINTILHEVAHALTPNHGHNKFWKRKAIEIGCTGTRCYEKHVIREKK